jgi:hypothetical protein
MGTSQSSPGAPSGVPLVPPWVPDPSEPADTPPLENPPVDDASPDVPPQLAPPARFKTTRTSLGRFAETGAADKLRQGVGHYFRTGLGGGGRAARRLGGTTRTAARLYSALSSLSAGGPATPGIPIDRTLLAGRSAEQVLDAVVDAVRPVDGTYDAESNRKAVRDALSEVLHRHPEAELENLNEEQRLLAVEAFTANDVFNRMIADVGKTIKARAPSTPQALIRLKEIQSYIRQVVAAEFRSLVPVATHLSSARLQGVVRRTLQNAIDVFESYLT